MTIALHYEILVFNMPTQGFPGGASGKESACQFRRQDEMWI